jgi:hypothetical protein
MRSASERPASEPAHDAAVLRVARFAARAIVEALRKIHDIGGFADELTGAGPTGEDLPARGRLERRVMAQARAHPPRATGTS